MRHINKYASLLGSLALSGVIGGWNMSIVTAAAPDCPIEQQNYAVEAQPKDTTRFAVIGDFGSAGKNEQAVAEMVDGWKPEFIVTVGDNNYTLGLAETIDANIGQYYHAYIGDYTGKYGAGSTENRFFPSLGNHDWGIDDIT